MKKLSILASALAVAATSVVPAFAGSSSTSSDPFVSTKTGGAELTAAEIAAAAAAAAALALALSQSSSSSSSTSYP